MTLLNRLPSTLAYKLEEDSIAKLIHICVGRISDDAPKDQHWITLETRSKREYVKLTFVVSSMENCNQNLSPLAL